MVKCQQTNKQTNKQTTAIAAAADTGYNNWHTELPIFNNRFGWCSLFWPCQP